MGIARFCMRTGVVKMQKVLEKILIIVMAVLFGTAFVSSCTTDKSSAIEGKKEWMKLLNPLASPDYKLDNDRVEGLLIEVSNRPKADLPFPLPNSTCREVKCSELEKDEFTLCRDTRNYIRERLSLALLLPAAKRGVESVEPKKLVFSYNRSGILESVEIYTEKAAQRLVFPDTANPETFELSDIVPAGPSGFTPARAEDFEKQVEEIIEEFTGKNIILSTDRGLSAPLSIKPHSGRAVLFREGPDSFKVYGVGYRRTKKICDKYGLPISDDVLRGFPQVGGKDEVRFSLLEGGSKIRFNTIFSPHSILARPLEMESDKPKVLGNKLVIERNGKIVPTSLTVRKVVSMPLDDFVSANHIEIEEISQ